MVLDWRVMGGSWLMRAAAVLTALVIPGVLSTPCRAELAPEEQFQVRTLAGLPTSHWVWVADVAMQRSTLFDGDTAEMLGMLNGGYNVRGVRPHISHTRGEIYVAETVYDRGHRGRRIDMVTIYDTTTLNVAGEVEIPPKSADAGHGVALAALLDDERFFLVFNQTPASSVSVVDLETRSFVTEIDTPGCALVYSAGPRRFFMLCGNGKAMLIELDAAGRETSRAEGEAFFDSVTDPISEKGARAGGSWFFVSFDGNLFELDVSGPTPVPSEPWPLISPSEREEGWRVGGTQHLAVHKATRRLYSLVHKGGPGSHKDPGEEIWVYDLDDKRRLSRIPVGNVLIPFLRTQLLGTVTKADDEETEGSLLDGLIETLANWVLPNPGAHSIAVTQDDEPLLFMSNGEIGAVTVHDALSGGQLRALAPTGVTAGRLVVP